RLEQILARGQALELDAHGALVELAAPDQALGRGELVGELRLPPRVAAAREGEPALGELELQALVRARGVGHADARRVADHELRPGVARSAGAVRLGREGGDVPGAVEGRVRRRGVAPVALEAPAEKLPGEAHEAERAQHERAAVQERALEEARA